MLEILIDDYKGFQIRHHKTPDISGNTTGIVCVYCHEGTEDTRRNLQNFLWQARIFRGVRWPSINRTDCLEDKNEIIAIRYYNQYTSDDGREEEMWALAQEFMQAIDYLRDYALQTPD